MNLIKEDIRNHRWGTIVSADKKLGFGLTTHYEYHQSIGKRKNIYPESGLESASVLCLSSENITDRLSLRRMTLSMPNDKIDPPQLVQIPCG